MAMLRSVPWSSSMIRMPGGVKPCSLWVVQSSRFKRVVEDLQVDRTEPHAAERRTPHVRVEIHAVEVLVMIPFPVPDHPGDVLVDLEFVHVEPGELRRRGDRNRMPEARQRHLPGA
jgi:hypothetical protein